MGMAKTLGRVRERFYWVHCRRDVQEWCRSCDLCASRRGPPRKIRAPMAQYTLGSPMERLAIDVVGPLPESESGNKYLLIAADYFSKWPEAYPIPNQEARTVADVLVKEFICRFGVPLYLHSDQGRNFEAAVFAEMCSLLGIKKTRTTVLHPQSEGMVERMNRTLEAQLSKFVDDHQRDWDEYIPLLLMAYRTAEHEATGYTPPKIMLGRNLRLPIDLLCGRPDGEHAEQVSSYAHELQQKLEQVHEFARSRLKIASDRMKLHYDSHQEGYRLEPGDPVWLHNQQRKTGVTTKLVRPWKGPYKVVKRINDLVYRIKLGPRAKLRVVHRNRLWKYEGQNHPDWFSENGPSQPNMGLQLGNLPSDPQNSLGLEDDMDDGPPLRRSGRSRNPPSRFGS